VGGTGIFDRNRRRRRRLPVFSALPGWQADQQDLEMVRAGVSGRQPVDPLPCLSLPARPAHRRDHRVISTLLAGTEAKSGHNIFKVLGYAFWIDGEWLGWDSIIDPEETKFSRLAELEREAELRLKYPNADPTLVPYFQDLLTLAEAYFCDTGQHLNVYGDIGELFGAIMYGIKRLR